MMIDANSESNKNMETHWILPDYQTRSLKNLLAELIAESHLVNIPPNRMRLILSEVKIVPETKNKRFVNLEIIEL